MAQNTGSKALLLQQLKNTHNNRTWFVPFNEAVKGLSAEQASQKTEGNHSVGQLVHHILFWTERNLIKIQNNDPGKFSGDNEETFDKFDQKQWESLIVRMDSVMTALEKWVENATEAQIQTHFVPLTNLAIHNAYHIGQIVTARKAQGAWEKPKADSLTLKKEKMKLNAGIVTAKLAETKKFYTEVLGFGVTFENDFYLLLHTPDRSAEISFLQPNHPSQQALFQAPFQGQGMYLTIEMDDVDALYKTLKDKGVSIKIDLRDEPWGDRHFAIQDPNGIGIDMVKYAPQ
jgi:catechol 2,3-dioxygenase-like lactoylglutathione lyase family enzyme/uncharacterized damage-inducible protein DinB